MARADLLPGYELRPLPAGRKGVPPLEPRGRRRMVAWASPKHFQYVSVRRMLIFLESSLSANLAWTVFQPNGPPLWAKVTQAVELYLLTYWRQGLLQGVTPDQAFFVRCDEATMTADQIADGMLDILVGVALVFPAEFVIIRIGAWTASAN